MSQSLGQQTQHTMADTFVVSYFIFALTTLCFEIFAASLAGLGIVKLEMRNMKSVCDTARDYGDW